MIESFGDTKTRRFYETGKASRFRGMNVDRAEELLALLDAITALSDIPPLASLNLHPLKGDLQGYWSITINGRWRMTFRFHDGDAHDVAITDYHKG